MYNTRVKTRTKHKEKKMSQQWDYRGFFCEIFTDENGRQAAIVYRGLKAISILWSRSEMNQKAINEHVDTILANLLVMAGE